MSSGYFLPIDTGGVQVFTQGATPSGWRQFNLPTSINTWLPGITVPAGATGMLVQAVAALNYCFSPSAAFASTAAQLTLPAGGTIVLSGREWITAFCVNLPASGASFTVQFFYGSIGPVPDINQPSTGGVIPPPPAGLSAVITQNTLHVMKSGNDATGARHRLDLPYLTIAAALADAVAGDRVYVWPGTYSEAITAVNGVDIYRLGATLSSPTGAGYLIDAGTGQSFTLDGWGPLLDDDNGVAYVAGGGSVVIYGSMESTNGPGAEVSGAGSTLTIHGSITASGIAANANNSGTLTITGNVTSSGANGVTVASSAVCTINGNITGQAEGALLGNLATFTAFGNINGRTRGIDCDRATVVVTGDVNSQNDEGVYVNTNGGSVLINGNVSSQGIEGISCGNGTLTVTGNVTFSGGGGHASTCDGGAVDIYGDAIIQVGGAGSTIGTTSGTTLVRGNVRNYGSGRGVQTNSTGSVEVYGDVEATDHNAVLLQGLGVTVRGRCITSSATQLVCVLQASRRLTLGLGVLHNTSGVAGIDVADTGGILILSGAAEITVSGGAVSITNSVGSGNVRSLGAYATTAAAGTLTIAGTLNILP